MKNLAIFLFVGLSKIIYAQGCLEAPNGQRPSHVLIPNCATEWQTVIDLGPAGEYALIQVSHGMNYKFESGVSIDWITISDESGMTILSTGEGTVTWTSNIDGIVRFYLHSSAGCYWNDGILRSRRVSCFNPYEQEYGCSQDYSRIGQYGAPIDNYLQHYQANDFFVPAGAVDYSLNSVKIHMGWFGEFPQNVTYDLSIHSDNQVSPGNILHTFQNISPSKIQQQHPEFFWHVTFDLNGLELTSNANEDTRYWLSMTAYSDDSAPTWFSTNYIEGWRTAMSFSSEDNQNWTPTRSPMAETYLEGTWFIDASCEVMDTEEMSVLEFSYYPNPVKDVLNLKSKSPIQNVSVYNLAGQKVISNSNLTNNQINISSLDPGVYLFRITLQGRKIETFKIIKK